MPVKKIALASAAVIMILLFILRPGMAVSSASESLGIWLFNVVPSIFPFIVCVNILCGFRHTDILGKKADGFMRAVFNLPSASIFAIITSALSGYPLGGKITKNLYDKKQINSDEAQRLLSFINNPSPVFIICTVGIGILGSEIFGRMIYLSCFLGAFLTALIFKFYYTEKPVRSKVSVYEASRNGDIMNDSVSAILKIGAYIVFFGIISDFLGTVPYAGNALSSLTEMTKGSVKINALITDARLKTSLIAFLLSFGGICIQFQIMGYLKELPVSRIIFFVSCILKAAFSALFCFALYPLFELKQTALASTVAEYAMPDGLEIFKLSVPIAIILGFIIYTKKRPS